MQSGILTALGAQPGRTRYSRKDKPVVGNITVNQSNIINTVSTGSAAINIIGSMGSGIDGSDATGIRLTNSPNGSTWRIASGYGGVLNSSFTIGIIGVNPPQLAISSSGTLSVSGSLSTIGTIITGSYTVATLPATTTLGRVTFASAAVTDALAPVIGATVVTGGAAKCLVCYNGTNWIVTAVL